jgi:hypothetical protein
MIQFTILQLFVLAVSRSVEELSSRPRPAPKLKLYPVTYLYVNMLTTTNDKENSFLYADAGLLDNQPLTFFSADRHHERMLNTMHEESRKAVTNTSEMLQFGMLVSDSTHDVVSEAKSLLSRWAEAPLSVSVDEIYGGDSHGYAESIMCLSGTPKSDNSGYYTDRMKIHDRIVDCVEKHIKDEPKAKCNDSRMTIEARQILVNERRALIEQKKIKRQAQKMAKENTRKIKQLAKSGMTSNSAGSEKELEKVRRAIDKDVALHIVTEQIEERAFLATGAIQHSMDQFRKSIKDDAAKKESSVEVRTLKEHEEKLKQLEISYQKVETLWAAQQFKLLRVMKD